MKKALNSGRNQGSSKKALVTGIGGFVGSHLTELLLSKNIAVFGFYHPSHSISNINHLKNKINLVSLDIFKSQNIEKNLKEINPDYVFHLAAISSPGQSFKNSLLTLENNILGQLNLLDSLVQVKSKAKILVVGSSEEYGNVEKNPVGEKTPIAPLSPYAISKVAQDFLGYQYSIHDNLQVVRVRPFNHTGPRQAPNFVVPAFASQIAQIEKTGKGTIKAGNLDSYRDFTDVRDMVKAYLLALEIGKIGEVYNIGSGRALKIADILNSLISLSSAKIEVKIDKSRFLPIDIEKIYCNYSKFRNQTGWNPEIPFIKTLTDTLEYERSKIR